MLLPLSTASRWGESSPVSTGLHDIHNDNYKNTRTTRVRPLPSPNKQTRGWQFQLSLSFFFVFLWCFLDVVYCYTTYMLILSCFHPPNLETSMIAGSKIRHTTNNINHFTFHKNTHLHSFLSAAWLWNRQQLYPFLSQPPPARSNSLFQRNGSKD